MSRTGKPNSDFQPTTVQSVDNCFELIDAMRSLGGEAGVTEIADATQLSKSSVHKHLMTLWKQGFVVKSQHNYRLSLRFLEMGGYVRSQLPASRYIKEKVVDLAHETSEVAFFHTEENGRSTILFREVGSNGVSTRSYVGMRTYLHQTAAGKAILSQYSEQRVEEIVEQTGLPKATEQTITDFDDLLADLALTRERGYTLSVEEATDGLMAVGVPIKLPNGEVLGGCAVAGPVHRIRNRSEDELPQILHSVANELELNITYS